MIWKKLLSNPPPEWQRLPLITRGVGNEVLRALDANGEIDCGDEDHLSVVCRILGAHPRERRRIREAIVELAREGFLTLEEGERRVIRGHLPDLATARPGRHPKPPQPSASGAPDVHQPSASGAPDVHQPSASGAPDVHQPSASGAPDVQWACSGRAVGVPEVGPNPPESFNTGPVEEKREEEKREREREVIGGPIGKTRDPEAPESRRTRALADEIRAGVERGYRAVSVPPPRETRVLTWPGWQHLAEWVIAKADLLGRADGDVARQTIRSFLASPKARSKGYPISFLVQNAEEFWQEAA